MSQSKSRFVLLCQQGLALGTVLAVAAPAAGVVTLHIVEPPHPSVGAGRVERSGTAVPARVAAPRSSAATADVLDGGTAPSLVSTAPVRSTVATVPFVGVSARGLRALRQPGKQPGKQPGTSHADQPEAESRHDGPAARLSAAGTAQGTGSHRLAALSAPEPVHGLGTVGVTWSHGVEVADRAIRVAVRTRRDGAWSSWTRVPYHEDEGPDPTSAEGRAESPGTDPVYVGDVDDVQVRALTASGRTPAGMRISLVDPGQATDRTLEQPAIDTARLGTTHTSERAAESPTPSPSLRSSASPTVSATTAGATVGTRSDDLTLASSVTEKPKIYSRAQWGADEHMREKAALHYGEIHGGFVHHTVNANDYSKAQVPALIRGIYAYHTQSRGWSDIGYNFLVDRFGRIWEGRYGGVNRPVVGAHTLGYNDDAFAMSAIGNYDLTQPSAALLDAFGRLFAWKLSLHGVRADATHQWIEQRYLPAIDGHRDVGQTACPGRYLYAQIPYIRRLARADQKSFTPRKRMTNLVGISAPDIVVRDRSSHEAYLLRTDHTGHLGQVTATGTILPHADKLMSAGDWNRDGVGDVIARSGHSGYLYLYRGTGTGRFEKPVRMSSERFGRVGLLAAVGDMTGDGRDDLIGQPRGGDMTIYPGTGHVGLKPGYEAHSALDGSRQVGVNFANADGAPDTLIRRLDGTLVQYPGNGPGGLTGGSVVGHVQGYDWLLAVGDLSHDGRLDLVGRSTTTGRLWTLPRTSTGSLGPRRAYSSGDLGRFDLAG